MKNVSVLIVDDNKDFTEGMEMVLEANGIEAEIAHSGEEALTKCKERSFDLTLMDVKMPGKNGVETFFEMRKNDPDARIMMMTGYGTSELLDEALGKGAWGVLRKPFDMQEVLNVIKSIKAGGICIADDDPVFLKTLAIILKEQGYTICTAQNGKEAIDCVKEFAPDFLILDLRMPILDGLRTYLELKKQGHNIPTIIITAYADQEIEAIEELRTLSVDRVLRKPFDPREIIKMIKNFSNN